MAFCQYLVIDRTVSASHQNQAINAIKFYYEKVLGGKRKPCTLQRPAKERQLPDVLNSDEITPAARLLPGIQTRKLPA